MDIRSLMIGGFIPAILLGVVNVLMKLGVKEETSLTKYLMVSGVAIFIYGTIGNFINGGKSLGLASAGYAVAMGVVWATAILCIVYALSTLRMPVSVVIPLVNTNTLVTVILGAIIFSEWKDLDPVKLCVGTVLIVIGTSLVSASR